MKEGCGMSSLVSEQRSSDCPNQQHSHSSQPSYLEQLHDISHWYAVYTCANREKQVALQFTSRGIDYFLPLYESVREWSDRRVTLQMPLFPGYLFVATSLRHQMRILTVPGVVNLVGVAGRPMPMDGDVIERLRDGIMRVAAQPYPYLPVGQRVFLCSGPLKGLTGVLLRHKSGSRVVISIDAIERAFIANVDANDLIPDGPILGLGALQKDD